MLRFFAIQSFLGVIAAVLLTACGGGGGGSASPAQVVISSSAPTDGTTGVAYTGFTFSASGGSGSYSWTETGALPPGLSFSTVGALSGTPVTAGTYSFAVTAADSSDSSLTDSKTFSIKIADSVIVISTSPAPPAGLLTHPYPGFAFAATGGSPPLTWTLKTGALPAGLILGNDGSLTGTVSATAVSSTFTVLATDSAMTPQSASQPFTVMVTDPGPPVIIVSRGPPAGTNGTVYPGFSFMATGGFLPLTWTVLSGKLPDGLTLGTDGSLMGTPTRAATFAFTVSVRDSRGVSATNPVPFSIVISNPPPPTINNTPPPTAIIGTPYSFRFTANGGLAPLVWGEPEALPGLVLSFDGTLSGTPTSAGHFPITVSVIDQLKQSATPMPFTVRISLARPAAAFTATKGNMTIARAGHTATLLLSGQVLIAGGPDRSAELYDPDPTSEMFTATTGQMTVTRSGHTATLLANAAPPNTGKVLIEGGGTQTAELYDSASRTFTQTGTPHVLRSGETATLLNTGKNSGKVLITGGATTLAAELYDPASGVFATTGNMTVARSHATATLLLSGEVLIAGGGSKSAEIYDPTTESFTATTNSMSEVRTGHTATLLADGSVLIVGSDVTAELYNPATGPATATFTSVGMVLPTEVNYIITAGVIGSTASLRRDGTVLIAGGHQTLYRRLPQSLASAELFAQESEGFTSTGSLHTARDGHTATLLGDGTILLTGGISHNVRAGGGALRPHEIATVLSSAELFK